MSDASSTGSGPYGHVSYFARITDDDHAGWLWVLGFLTLIYPLLSLYVRLQVRVSNYGVEDWMICVATVSNIQADSCTEY